MADGIATMDGRCYCQVADGRATTGWVVDTWQVVILVFFILFYYIYILCFTHDVIVTHDVVGDYVYEV